MVSGRQLEDSSQHSHVNSESHSKYLDYGRKSRTPYKNQWPYNYDLLSLIRSDVYHPSQRSYLVIIAGWDECHDKTVQGDPTVDSSTFNVQLLCETITDHK